MYYNVNLIAIIISSLGVMLLGWAWYSPKLFGTMYQKLNTKETTQGGIETIAQVMTKEHVRRGFIVMFISGLIQSAVLYFLILVTRAGTLSQFMTIVFLVWAGFNLTNVLTENTWKGSSPKLMLIDAFYYLVANIVIVLILLFIL